MAVLRFLAALLALVAVVALLVDLTPLVTGTGSFKTTPLATHWSEITPRTLEAAKTAVSNALSPAAWDSILAPLLGLPAFLLLGLLSFIVGYAGRRRRQVKIHIN